MDPEVPRTLGDLEDSEPERRSPARSNPVKKTLDEFLRAFEERLREHPDEAATSASAAVQGRADGSWRTPVEGVERMGRRLPRRVPWQRQEGESHSHPAATGSAPTVPSLPGPLPAPVDVGAAGPALPAAPASGPFADAPEPADVPREPPVAEPAAAAKRRNRPRRRHRHR